MRKQRQIMEHHGYAAAVYIKIRRIYAVKFDAAFIWAQEDPGSTS